jgi:NhaP-type Na+/H+ or K+/H+ antiporter
MDLSLGLGILAIVLLVTALASGIVERAPVSFPMIFLGLGLVLGPAGFGVLQLRPDDPILHLVAVLTLSLVLFLDAVNLERAQERHDLVVPLLTLGPGTVIVFALTAGAAILLLHLPVLLAVLLGAILASTDPVVLRDVTRDVRLPMVVRRALQIEAGANDVIVLPIVLVMLALAQHQAGTPGQWAVFLLKLLVVGPVCGFVIGGAGAWLMTQADARFGIRSEFQALYGIGLVFAAYATGSTVGVDGFLAAFAAGLAVTVLDQELCDCFLEYGEATSLMAMLLSFVLFGALLSGTLPGVPLAALGLAAFVIFVARPAAVGALLARVPHLGWRGRAFIAWFGPRGLTSLLFALIVVSSGLAGSVELLAVTGVVVLASVVLHGTTAVTFSDLYARSIAKETQDVERESRFGGLFEAGDDGVARITPEELAERLSSPDPPIVLDVRTRSQYERDHVRIPGSIRVMPDQVREWAVRQPTRQPVVLYCT